MLSHNGIDCAPHDKAGNHDLFCQNCSIVFNPHNEQIRHKRRISVTDRDQEPLIAHAPGLEYLNRQIEIRHDPKLSPTFRTLQQKGLKITDYK